MALVRPDLAAAAATRVREDYVRRHPEFTEHAAFVLCGTGRRRRDPRGLRHAASTEPHDRDDAFPGSIAIAGAWGYIGRKFLDVALARGLTTFVYDPGPPPDDVDLSRLVLVRDEADFYRLDAELFHLAVHPEHRRDDLLLARPGPPPILNEKPMAEPGHPQRCRRVVAAVDASRAVMLYDFPELFDPLTARILDFLGGFRDLRIAGISVQRSKDREDPGNPRTGNGWSPSSSRRRSIAWPSSSTCSPRCGEGWRARSPEASDWRASPPPMCRRTRRPTRTRSTADAATGRHFGGVRGRGADRLQAGPRGPSGA